MDVQMFELESVFGYMRVYIKDDMDGNGYEIEKDAGRVKDVVRQGD
jgi:hypothetical protein